MILSTDEKNSSAACLLGRTVYQAGRLLFFELSPLVFESVSVGKMYKCLLRYRGILNFLRVLVSSDSRQVSHFMKVSNIAIWQHQYFTRKFCSEDLPTARGLLGQEKHFFVASQFINLFIQESQLFSDGTLLSTYDNFWVKELRNTYGGCFQIHWFIGFGCLYQYKLSLFSIHYHYFCIQIVYREDLFAEPPGLVFHNKLASQE